MDNSTNMSGMSISMDTNSSSDTSIAAGGDSDPLLSPTEAAVSNATNNPAASTNNLSSLKPKRATENNNGRAYPNSSSSWDVTDAKNALREATHLLSDHGLKLASKWTAEQLIGLAPVVTPMKSFDFRDEKYYGYGGTGADSPVSMTPRNDLELYAKSILDIGEYHRAANVLSFNPFLDDPQENNQQQQRNSWKQSKSIVKAQSGDLGIQPPKKNLTSYGIYLRAYALYMAGERRKEEEVLELRDPLERTSVLNSYLPQLVCELHNAYVDKKLDAFGLYMYGVVLKESQKSPSCYSGAKSMNSNRSSPRTVQHHHHGMKDSIQPTAHSIFIESLIQYPYNWSAWLDLAVICINEPSHNVEVEALLKPLSDHWMYHFFCVHTFLENQANEDAIVVMEKLVHGQHEGFNSNNGFFISSPYLQTQLAVANNNLRDFDTAQAHFTRSAECDPYRLDHMDVYSNILYVKEDKVALSNLAHRAVKLDKYRPETCCVVGNYYSLKGQHEKAVQYFQRALKLDRSYLSAWTLMGHEYLEMRNTAAAIEAYRRAVDINAKDYRAWYGLGQIYEIMNMLLYALFYFQKAVEILPNDPRMWCAMGKCYLGLEKRGNAIRSYERAVANNDFEGVATWELAQLYNEDGDSEKAARCYLRHLELVYQAQLSQASMSPEGATIQSVISSVNIDEKEAEALLNLASYHRDHGKFEMASLCCSRLLDYHGHPEREQAKSLLREIRSIIDKSQEKRNKMPVSSQETFEFSP